MAALEITQCALYILPVIVRRTRSEVARAGFEISPRGLIRLKETIMTTITYGRQAVRNQGVEFAPGLLGRVKGYVERSRAERQLHQLDDRMLADIGMQRGDISKLVRGK
jgi:uncharacterized protein YjiS (DUF1127 family)